MENKSLAQKVIAERGFRLELLSLKDEAGNDVYAYILVNELKYPELELAVNSKTPFNPEEFGVILSAGFGKTPPEEIKNEVYQIFKSKIL